MMRVLLFIAMLIVFPPIALVWLLIRLFVALGRKK